MGRQGFGGKARSGDSYSADSDAPSPSPSPSLPITLNRHLLPHTAIQLARSSDLASIYERLIRSAYRCIALTWRYMSAVKPGGSLAQAASN